MRILVVSDLWCPFPGGAEVLVRNIVLELVKRGHVCHILTSYKPHRSEDLFSIEYKPIPVGTDGHGEGWRQIAETIKEFKPQIIMTHHFFAGEFPELFDRAIPTIEIIHSRPRTPKATIAIFNSYYTANTPGQLRLPQDYVILPMPAPDCRVEHSDFHETFRRPYIGHIKPLGGKGIMMTYALAKRFPERQFMILRGEWQGGETMISNTPNVHYMEPVQDIRDFYKHCRLILMPSEREEAGTVPFEATINSIPCISSDVMGLPETNAGGTVMPISLHVWDPNQPLHPDNESIDKWEAKIKEFDNEYLYGEAVARQARFMRTVNWASSFDQLDLRIRQLNGVQA